MKDIKSARYIWNKYWIFQCLNKGSKGKLQDAKEELAYKIKSIGKMDFEDIAHIAFLLPIFVFCALLLVYVLIITFYKWNMLFGGTWWVFIALAVTVSYLGHKFLQSPTGAQIIHYLSDYSYEEVTIERCWTPANKKSMWPKVTIHNKNLPEVQISAEAIYAPTTSFILVKNKKDDSDMHIISPRFGIMSKVATDNVDYRRVSIKM